MSKPIIRNIKNINLRHGHEDTVKVWRFFAESEFVSPLISFSENIVEPGMNVPPHDHIGKEEIYYITNGSGILWIDDEETPVAKGDAILIPHESRHGILNNSDEELRFILVEANISETKNV